MSKRAEPKIIPVIPGSKVELEFSRQAIAVTPFPEWYPDPEWSWTDSAGNRHAWVITGKDEEGYPEGELPETLRWVVDAEATDEYPEGGHYESVFTGEAVNPGVKYKPMVDRYAIGPLRCEIALELGPELPDKIAALGELDLSEIIRGASGRCLATRRTTADERGRWNVEITCLDEPKIPGYTIPEEGP